MLHETLQIACRLRTARLDSTRRITSATTYEDGGRTPLLRHVFYHAFITSCCALTASYYAFIAPCYAIIASYYAFIASCAFIAPCYAFIAQTPQQHEDGAVRANALAAAAACVAGDITALRALLPALPVPAASQPARPFPALKFPAYSDLSSFSPLPLTGGPGRRSTAQPCYVLARVCFACGAHAPISCQPSFNISLCMPLVSRSTTLIHACNGAMTH
jgi:hypothetical protein